MNQDEVIELIEKYSRRQRERLQLLRENYRASPSTKHQQLVSLLDDLLRVLFDDD